MRVVSSRGTESLISDVTAEVVILASRVAPVVCGSLHMDARTWLLIPVCGDGPCLRSEQVLGSNNLLLYITSPLTTVLNVMARTGGRLEPTPTLQPETAEFVSSCSR